MNPWVLCALDTFYRFFSKKINLPSRKISSGVFKGQIARNIEEQVCQLFFESFGRSVGLWIHGFFMRLILFSVKLMIPIDHFQSRALDSVHPQDHPSDQGVLQDGLE